MEALLHYLLEPASGAAGHVLDTKIAWHGRIMVLAWGVLIPLGIIIARFLKVTPGQAWPQRLDNPFWWHSHRLTQYGGVALSLIGTALILSSVDKLDMLRSTHTTLGWLVVCMGLTQVVAGFLRGSKGGPTGQAMRGDHYDMTPRRIWFERAHKTVGYAALLMACATLLLGLAAADAPRWMWLALMLWWFFIAVIGYRWQTQGRAFDTYQAIWGPNEQHPGNRRLPVGLGVHRSSRESYEQGFPKSLL